MKLVIGEKNWSTWALRTWLVLKGGGFEFDEAPVRLRRETTAAEIAKYSPSGWVPALIVGDITIWDSIAICEYLAEQKPFLWPATPLARAHARSVVSEMHSGFLPLRKECPMDLRLRTRTELSPDTAGNVRRIVSMWRDARSRYRHLGPFMFGDWSIADAYYTPVATRFRTYSIDLGAFGDNGDAAAYGQHLLANPHFLEWEAAALASHPA